MPPSLVFDFFFFCSILSVFFEGGGIVPEKLCVWKHRPDLISGVMLKTLLSLLLRNTYLYYIIRASVDEQWTCTPFYLRSNFESQLYMKLPPSSIAHIDFLRLKIYSSVNCAISQSPRPSPSCLACLLSSPSFFIYHIPWSSTFIFIDYWPLSPSSKLWENTLNRCTVVILKQQTGEMMGKHCWVEKLI